LKFSPIGDGRGRSDFSAERAPEKENGAGALLERAAPPHHIARDLPGARTTTSW
jgi:hypothetical protein